jgi:predicted small metal-binding protein
MKELHCKDLKRGCNFVARGRTTQSVMSKTAKHAKAAHGIEKMTAAMTRKARGAVHTV